ncbi:MAG TPA: glycogen debranching N-terminal domain-containing protein [Micromonosporaceae bacterium]|nr:glycogen debranching N-terminal domain-containing protein [Micromonosporaceae bacterium]
MPSPDDERHAEPPVSSQPPVSNQPPVAAQIPAQADARPAAHFGPAPIHRLVATVCAPACVLADADGQLRPVGVAGLYVGDTRALRRAVVTVDGAEPDPLGWQHDGPGITTFFATIREMGDPIPDPTVRLDRTRSVRSGGLDETIRVRSTATAPVRAEVRLQLDCDLTPMELARAGRWRSMAAAALDGNDLVWTGGGATVRVSGADATVRVADPTAGLATAVLTWQIELRTDEEVTLRWSVRVQEPTAVVVTPSGPVDWSRPTIHAADPRIARLVERAIDDLASLRVAEPGQPNDAFIAAGVPWFLTLFGRDSIWAARMMLPLGTSVAEGTLRALARRQGSHLDAASGEAPGKIMHELRRRDTRLTLPGAPSAGPHGPTVYYGTVDATLLWISLLADAWRWGLPDRTVAGFLPTLRGALGWLERYADPNGDGFIEYFDVTGRGLANQGWKDSGTAVRFHDGRTATPPIALCEVQGYAHRAALDAARLLEAFGDAGHVDALADPDHWRGYAANLADAFRDRFWRTGPLGAFPAQGIDGTGHPIDALTSNIGHLLGTGLLNPAEESTVAALLGAPELSGGYGLRTMSTLDGAYDPMTYHCGSIWPHDTAIALLGLASMASDHHARGAATTLINGLLAAADAFDYRLPELYSGDARDEVSRPLAHPAACRPQAWSAAAGIALLQALLGLSVDVPAGDVSITPMMAGPLRVAGLRIGERLVDIDVDASGRVEMTGAAATGDHEGAAFAGRPMPAPRR